jgi:hypothetical protein
MDDLQNRMTSHRGAHLWLYGHDVTDQDFTAAAA